MTDFEKIGFALKEKQIPFHEGFGFYETKAANTLDAYMESFFLIFFFDENTDEYLGFQTVKATH
jgi:hypothetical protein